MTEQKDKKEKVEKKVEKKTKKKASALDSMILLVKQFVALGVLGTVAIGSFLVGSRYYDLGYNEEALNGSTVLISGKCKYKGMERDSLHENEFKIIKYDRKNDSYEGILRLYNEYLECPAGSVHIDKLPLYDYIVNGKVLKSPKVDIKPFKIAKKEENRKYMAFNQKTVRISGGCIDINTKKNTDVFVDELMDVSSVSPLEGGKFALLGTMRKSKQPVECVDVKREIVSKAELEKLDMAKKIKEGKVVIEEAKKREAKQMIEEQAKEKLFSVGETVKVTGICFPYKTKHMKNVSWCGGKKKPVFHTFANRDVKILQFNENKNEEVTRLIGTTEDENKCIIYVDCDKKKQPELLFEKVN